METIVVLILFGIPLSLWIVYYNKKHGKEEERRYQENRAKAQLERQRNQSEEEKAVEKKRQEIALREQEAKQREKEIEDSKLKMIESLNQGVIPPECFEFPKEKSPILLTKSERFIMAWFAINTYTTKMKTRMKGGSSGFTIRIAKGFSVRTGQARGQAERYEDVEELGRCRVFVTDRNVYLQTVNGRVKKCPTSQIVAINNTSDGLQVEFNRLNPLLFEIEGTDRELMRASMSYYVRFMSE